MSSITFNDGTGSTNLTNGKTGVLQRFSGWTPFRTSAGPNIISLGTGARREYSFREDYGASFSLRYIPASQLTDWLRFKRWLEAGGTATVTTDDASSRTYTVAIQPGSTIDLAFEDPVEQEFTISLSVRNQSQAVMLCVWS